MNHLLCIPLYLYPLQNIKFQRCHVIPGVRLLRPAGELEEAIRRAETTVVKSAGAIRFKRNFVVCIDSDEYWRAMVSRLRTENISIEDSHVAGIRGEVIARQVLVSLCLNSVIQFEFGDLHAFSRTPRGRSWTYSYAGSSRGRHIEQPAGLSLVPANEQSYRPILANDVARVASQLDVYFRATYYRTDRIARAICHLWNGMCANEPSQAFLDFMTSLEALLSSGGNEITHMLSERVAVLLKSKTQRGSDIYRIMKSLYTVRSNIVHGKEVHLKKGAALKWNTFYVTARGSNVPVAQIAELRDIVRRVIKKIINDDEIRSAIQSATNDDISGKVISDIFLKRLLDR